MIELRPYQKEAVYDLIPNLFKSGHKRIVRCAPTGSGKSHEIAEMTKLAYEKGKRVLLLSHRAEIFSGLLKQLSYHNIPVIDLKAGQRMPCGDWRIMLAMEKTIWNRIKKEPDRVLRPDLIIADEIHFMNFNNIISHFHDSYLIGFSATPQGKHLHKIYTAISSNIDTPELIAQVYLVKDWARQMEDDFSDVKISKGEFEDASMFKHFDKPKLYAGIIDKYNEHLKGEKGIVFCCNIKHTENTYDIFREAGINTFKAHSDMPQQEREYNVKEFMASNDGVMINASILTTGFDCPSIAFVILYRATTSLPLFLQMIGRGARPYPGKKYFKVIDFGKNHERHGGSWSWPRTWSLDPPKKRNKLQASAMKNCPSCGAILPAATRKCEFCKYEFPKPTSELREGVLCEVESGGIPLGLKGKRIGELTIEELMQCQKTKKLKHSYIWRVLRSMEAGYDNIAPVECLSAYAKLMGYKNGWLFSQRKKIENGEIGFKNYKLT